jgi:hypothetical protein
MGDYCPKEAVLEVKTWPKDSIAAGPRHTVGLKSDGTVTALVIINMANVMLADGVIWWRSRLAMFIWQRILEILIPSGLNRTVR